MRKGDWKTSQYLPASYTINEAGILLVYVGAKIIAEFRKSNETAYRWAHVEKPGTGIHNDEREAVEWALRDNGYLS